MQFRSRPWSVVNQAPWKSDSLNDLQFSKCLEKYSTGVDIQKTTETQQCFPKRIMEKRGQINVLDKNKKNLFFIFPTEQQNSFIIIVNYYTNLLLLILSYFEKSNKIVQLDENSEKSVKTCFLTYTIKCTFFNGKVGVLYISYHSDNI